MFRATSVLQNLFNAVLRMSNECRESAAVQKFELQPSVVRFQHMERSVQTTFIFS